MAKKKNKHTSSYDPHQDKAVKSNQGMKSSKERREHERKMQEKKDRETNISARAWLFAQSMECDQRSVLTGPNGDIDMSKPPSSPNDTPWLLGGAAPNELNLSTVKKSQVDESLNHAI